MNEDENDSLLTTWMADIEKCEHVNELPLAMHGVILEHVDMTKSWKSNKFQNFFYGSQIQKRNMADTSQMPEIPKIKKSMETKYK